MTKRLFLDTTIQVDRVLKDQPPERLAPLKALLAEFDCLITCSYSRLEFKRVVIQHLALVLDYLREEQSYFGALLRAQAVGATRPRRASTLISITAWLGLNVQGQIEATLGEGIDRQLALKAESYIRNAILFLWKRFDKSVRSVQDRTQCKRATEGPRRTTNGGLDVAIPHSKCKARECNNANFFRSNLPRLKALRDKLRQLSQAAGGTKLTKELETALKQIEAGITNPSSFYDYQTCVSIGDVWLHLEAAVAGVKDFAPTNDKESQVLCPIFGLNMRQPAQS
jgi:hypothetical protein